MKKRKAPVLLLTLLVLLVGGVIVYGVNGNASNKPDTGDKVTGNEANGADPNEVGQSIQNNTPSHPHPTIAVPNGGQGAKGPSIAMPENVGIYPKPKPSPDGSTSSQWYSKPAETAR